jgi:hypothetical protein
MWRFGHPSKFRIIIKIRVQQEELYHVKWIFITNPHLGGPQFNTNRSIKIGAKGLALDDKIVNQCVLVKPISRVTVIQYLLPWQWPVHHLRGAREGIGCFAVLPYSPRPTPTASGEGRRCVQQLIHPSGRTWRGKVSLRVVNVSRRW